MPLRCGRDVAALVSGLSDAHVNCLRVLIVEDGMIIALSLELMVEELGHTVCTIATSAQTALAATAECRPDVVLMDIPPCRRQRWIAVALQIRQRFNIPAIY